MPSRPHVLLLWCDQMQANRLGTVDPVAHTPFLDSLAAQGSHLTHAISTHGQCVPSRASLMTGLYPHECGVMVNYGFHGHQNRLSTRHRTLGHVFTDAGYETAYYGKCHFGLPLADLGFEHAHDYDQVEVDETRAAELYDLAADPHELRNLAGDPPHTAVRQQLAAEAERWWTATGGRTVDYYESDQFKANAHNTP